MRPFSTGLIIGKFSPPHAGHNWLINYAYDHCAQLDIVLVHYKDRADYLATAAVRLGWLGTRFNGANYTNIIWHTYIPDPAMPDIDDDAWARETMRVIARRPEALFSFDYLRDSGYAQAMSAAFVVPPGTPPVRSTLIRGNPEEYIQHVDPVVREWYQRQDKTRGVSDDRARYGI